tara:strand:+ start:1098 stop:2129 length:1032 start_codon:yes stop_codon:yes gene_type:complete
LKKTGQLIVGLIIAALASYFTFRNVSWTEFTGSFSKVKYVYLVPAILITLLSFVSRVLRWWVLLQPLKAVRISELFSPLFIGYMGNLLPARAGEFLRAWLVSKKHKIAFSGSIATIVVERVFDLIMLLVLFTWLLLFQAEIFDAGISWRGIPLSDIAFKFGVFGMAVVGFLVVFIYLMLFHRPKLVSVVQWIIRPFPGKWHESVESLFEKFSEGLVVIRNRGALAKIITLSIVTWVLMTLSYYPLFLAYDLENQSVGALVLLIVMICIFISVFPTPGFLGSFHAGVLVALHNILGESEIMIVNFGMVAWGFNMLIIVIGGLYFVLHEHLSVKELVGVQKSKKE